MLRKLVGILNNIDIFLIVVNLVVNFLGVSLASCLTIASKASACAFELFSALSKSANKSELISRIWFPFLFIFWSFTYFWTSSTNSCISYIFSSLLASFQILWKLRSAAPATDAFLRLIWRNSCAFSPDDWSACVVSLLTIFPLESVTVNVIFPFSIDDFTVYPCFSNSALYPVTISLTCVYAFAIYACSYWW